MGTLTTDDGVKLYYEETGEGTGEGTPIVFVHEYAGDHRSWEPQVRYFARRYRVHHLQRQRLSAIGCARRPARIQFKNKDSRGFAEATRQLAEHSAVGSANTMRGYQGRRPSLYDLIGRIAAIDVPVLVMSGDEDEPCLEPSLLLKRTISQAALAVLPASGHAINLEEPALFNQLLDDFLRQVESGRWRARDPAAACPSIHGPSGDPNRP